MRFLALSLLVVLTACQPVEDVRYEVRSFAELPNWNSTDLVSLKNQLKTSCKRFAKPLKTARPEFSDVVAWNPFCEELKTVENGDLKSLIERRLQPVEIVNGKGALFTGYYSPVLEASLEETAIYKYPLRTPPVDLLTLNLGEFDEDLNGQLKARVRGRKVVPYADRAEIEKSSVGPAVAWLKDPVEKFGLQIQGSGVLELDNGSRMTVGFADHNGRDYTAIGRTLIHKGALAKEDVTWQNIVAWLEANPSYQQEVFNSNARYIFFREVAGNPRGAANVSLTENQSIAVDPAYVPLGLPTYVATTLTAENVSYTRLMVAEDVGAAIKGPVRGDIYFGLGDEAEKLAGRQNSGGKLYILLPRGVIK
jgi:membrane-bound lytic murein transglycosylase A